MGPVRSWPDGVLVADASVWINLVAGTRASEVVQACENRFQIPRIALDELERGREKGRQTAATLTNLITAGLVDVVELPQKAEETFLGLVAGGVSQTLDDGEAATLALALQTEAVAIIDERKAVNLAQERFPNLRVLSTTELLLSEAMQAAFPPLQIQDLLFRALKDARMRVPEPLLDAVCKCIGPDRAAECLSLPARVRKLVADGRY
ncbi:type II toxin-antitoxin system VapC family toxin [Rhodopseudomonas palustris]|uniref:type II toxin-antitoxin system VapC family toxin n=1 Tax=Rhodopseudomonas palustris TaxID=1076 RepID=UPI0020CC8D59|nr:type II toxin-antitoxin system VapC family toxin [Rhodopseudomonas palustris]MCP9630185.1 type II toxin-antitoxin system VapC family toxin [Rhodopseudomonas palustris]